MHARINMSEMLTLVPPVKAVRAEPVKSANQLVHRFDIPWRAIENHVAGEIVKVQSCLDPVTEQKHLRSAFGEIFELLVYGLDISRFVILRPAESFERGNAKTVVRPAEVQI